MRLVSRSHNRRGNALYAVTSVMALVSIGALAVDIGHLRGARAELQRAADAGAHAGSLYLDASPEGCEAAEKAALWFSNANIVDGRRAEFVETDISFYSYRNGVLTPTAQCDETSNTLRLNKSLDNISTLLAPFAFGVNSMTARSRSTVLQTPPSAATAVSCYLPVAIPQCAITGKGTFNFRRSSNGADTAGWASLVSGSTNADFFKEQLSGTHCEGAEVSDRVLVQNGSVMAAEAVARDRINHKAQSSGQALTAPDAWPTDIWDPPEGSDRLAFSRIQDRYYGKFGIGGPIMLITAGDADHNGVDDLCDPSPPNFTGEMGMAGFAYGMIYDANSGDIAIEVNTEHNFDDYATAGGGDNPFGLVFKDPPTLLE